MTVFHPLLSFSPASPTVFSFSSFENSVILMDDYSSNRCRCTVAGLTFHKINIGLQKRSVWLREREGWTMRSKGVGFTRWGAMRNVISKHTSFRPRVFGSFPFCARPSSSFFMLAGPLSAHNYPFVSFCSDARFF